MRKMASQLHREGVLSFPDPRSICCGIGAQMVPDLRYILVSSSLTIIPGIFEPCVKPWSRAITASFPVLPMHVQGRVASWPCVAGHQTPVSSYLNPLEHVHFTQPWTAGKIPRRMYLPKRLRPYMRVKSLQPIPIVLSRSLLTTIRIVVYSDQK
jgi:hypothetical protein